jgi:hypothetical protein
VFLCVSPCVEMIELLLGNLSSTEMDLWESQGNIKLNKCQNHDKVSWLREWESLSKKMKKMFSIK